MNVASILATCRHLLRPGRDCRDAVATDIPSLLPAVSTKNN